MKTQTEEKTMECVHGAKYGECFLCGESFFKEDMCKCVCHCEEDENDCQAYHEQSCEHCDAHQAAGPISGFAELKYKGKNVIEDDNDKKMWEKELEKLSQKHYGWTTEEWLKSFIKSLLASSQDSFRRKVEGMRHKIDYHRRCPECDDYEQALDEVIELLKKT